MLFWARTICTRACYLIFFVSCDGIIFRSGLINCRILIIFLPTIFWFWSAEGMVTQGLVGVFDVEPPPLVSLRPLNVIFHVLFDALLQICKFLCAIGTKKNFEEGTNLWISSVQTGEVTFSLQWRDNFRSSRWRTISKRITYILYCSLLGYSARALIGKKPT